MKFYYHTNKSGAKKILKHGFQLDCASKYLNSGCGIYVDPDHADQHMREFKPNRAVLEITISDRTASLFTKNFTCDASDRNIGTTDITMDDWCEDNDVAEEYCAEEYSNYFGDKVDDMHTWCACNNISRQHCDLRWKKLPKQKRAEVAKGYMCKYYQYATDLRNEMLQQGCKIAYGKYRVYRDIKEEEIVIYDPKRVMRSARMRILSDREAQAKFPMLKK